MGAGVSGTMGANPGAIRMASRTPNGRGGNKVLGCGGLVENRRRDLPNWLVWLRLLATKHCACSGMGDCPACEMTKEMEEKAWARR